MREESVTKRVLVKDRNWGSIISRYQDSGEKLNVFCRKEGIPPSSLRDNLGLRKKRVPSNLLESFIPVEFPRSVKLVEVELEFRDGTKLRIKG